MIWRALYWTLDRARLEYAFYAWAPFTNKGAKGVRNDAKPRCKDYMWIDRKTGVTDAKERLQLKELNRQH